MLHNPSHVYRRERFYQKGAGKCSDDCRPPKPTKEQVRYLQGRACALSQPQSHQSSLHQAAGQLEAAQDANGKAAKALPDHIQAAFDEALWAGPHAGRLQAASLIVGLHPDQVPCFSSALREAGAISRRRLIDKGAAHYTTRNAKWVS